MSIRFEVHRRNVSTWMSHTLKTGKRDIFSQKKTATEAKSIGYTKDGVAYLTFGVLHDALSSRDKRPTVTISRALIRTILLADCRYIRVKFAINGVTFCRIRLKTKEVHDFPLADPRLTEGIDSVKVHLPLSKEQWETIDKLNR